MNSFDHDKSVMIIDEPCLSQSYSHEGSVFQYVFCSGNLADSEISYSNLDFGPPRSSWYDTQSTIDWLFEKNIQNEEHIVKGVLRRKRRPGRQPVKPEHLAYKRIRKRERKRELNRLAQARFRERILQKVAHLENTVEEDIGILWEQISLPRFQLEKYQNLDTTFHLPCMSSLA